MYPMQISKSRRKRQKSKAKELLSSVGLGDVDQESCRRCSPAVSSSASPSHGRWRPTRKLSLADEPTGNLDTENGKVVIDLLKKLVKDENYCVIVVTHDPASQRRRTSFTKCRMEVWKKK